MSEPRKLQVQKRAPSEWEVRAPGATRASAIARTQAEAIKRGREILANSGGGELQTRSLKGTIRAQDTIAPGNDPRASKG